MVEHQAQQGVDYRHGCICGILREFVRLALAGLRGSCSRVARCTVLDDAHNRQNPFYETSTGCWRSARPTT